MDPLSIVIGLIVLTVAVVVAGYFYEPLGQFLRIRSKGALNKGSTAVERNRDRLNQVVAKLPAQRALVASVMSAADAAKRNVDAKKAEAAAALKRYQDAKGLNTSAEALGQLSTNWKTANDAIAGLEQLWSDATATAAQAQEELDSMVDEIKAQEANLQSDQAKADLAAAKRETAGFRQQIADMKNGLGAMAADRAAVQKELDDANNLDKLSQGSEIDRELARIDKAAKAKSAQEEIEAALKAANEKK